MSLSLSTISIPNPLSSGCNPSLQPEMVRPPLLLFTIAIAIAVAITIICLPCSSSSSSSSISPADMVQNSVRRQGIDTSLLKYTFLALAQNGGNQNPSDSAVYTINLIPSLSGISAQARRISSLSNLQKQGLTFNEFSLPAGSSSPSISLRNPSSSASSSALIDDSSPLLLIYRRIFNFTVYSLPPAYDFAGPIVGIIAFSPPNFTVYDPSLPELTIASSMKITIHAPRYSSLPSTSPVPLCALFSANGSISFTAMAAPPNVCVFDSFGDVALVLQWPQDNPPPEQPESETGQQNGPSSSSSSSSSSSAVSSLNSHSSGKMNNHWKLALGVTCLTLAGVAFCVVLVISSIGFVRRLKVSLLARFTGNEEALQTSLIGVSRAPTAAGVRTKPALEMDMASF